MADPLSVAASIAGLVSLADIVFIRLVKFGRSVKNAEKEIQELSREVNLLGGALNSLSRLVRALEDGPNVDEFGKNLRLHDIEDCSDTLQEMSRDLHKFEASAGSTKQKLKWPFAKHRVKEWLDDLSRYKANINLSLSATSLEVMFRLLSQGDSHATEILAGIKETRKITSRIHQDGQQLKVLEFFLRHNPQKNFDMSMRLRHPRTGLWLQKRQEFKVWLSKPGSKLWFKGIPGAGKTVLAGSIIEAALGRNSESTPSAFFFCDYREADTQSIENILSALVYQLALQKKDAYTMLEGYYDELHPNNSLPKQPARKALLKLLEEMLGLFDHTYIVIDGLDECGKSTYELLLSVSRDEDEIRNRLKGIFTSIEITAEEADITEYVTIEMAERVRTGRLRIDSADLHGEILQELIDGAKGMFRWVACQLDHLGECDSDQECRDALKSLPPTLDKTYERILGKVPKSKQRITELALNCVASLVRKSADGLYLEFSHFSVQEFLEKVNAQLLGFEWLRVSKSRAYYLLAVECLRFIQLRNFDRVNIEAETEGNQIECRNKLHPLYLHASTRWPIYARGEWEKQTVFDLAVSLFHPSKTSHFTSWAIQLASGIDTSQTVDVESIVLLFIDPDFTPLHMAAALSLPQICSFLVEQGMRVNLKSPVGRPLQCAVQSLQFGCVNDDLRGEAYRKWVIPELQENQLDHIATVDTIRYLCRAEASLNFQCCDPFSSMNLVQLSLFMLEKVGTFQLTTVLIEEGAQLDDADVLFVQGRLSRFWNTRQHEAEIQACIRSLNKCAGQSSAHHRMSGVLWKHAVGLGLGFASDPTVVDTQLSLTNEGLGKHAISAVAISNVQVLKRILYDQRFKVASFVDDNGDSLLHLALRSRCKAGRKTLEIVKILLYAGCDAGKPNRQGMDPLQSWGWFADDPENPTAEELMLFDEAACLLADYGASCARQSSKDRNALHLHVSEPFRMRALLKYQSTESVKEAMEMVDNDGYTPLTLSLRKAFILSASILLAQNSTITAKMIQSPTAALSLAVRAGDEKSFGVLLLSDIDFHFETFETPLHYVSSQTSLDLVRRLKIVYPEACSSRFNGNTPLELFLKRCVETSGVRNINASIINELSIPACFNSENTMATIWNFFSSQMISSAMQLPMSWTGIEDTGFQKDDKAVVTETAGMSLIQLGYLESFESCFEMSGIIPLLEAFSGPMDTSDFWPRLKDLVYEILRQTQQWDSVREQSGAILLLKKAVHSFDVRVARMLLERGISVHERADGISVLESIISDPKCDPSAPSLDFGRAKEMLDLVLSYSDKSRINDVIPDSNGLALIHLPTRWDAAWIIKKLVDHGADPNLRVSKEPYRPASVHHFAEFRTDHAKAILNNGGDPTLADDYGLDTALMAAFRDGVSVLTEIHSDINYGVEKWWHDKMDWRRKCEVRISLGGDWLLCTGATALHLGATNLSTEVLGFYIDQQLIEGLDIKSEEGHTPLHFAASTGSIRNIEYLLAHGCDVNACAKDGSSPLHIAARNNKKGAARALIEAGCKSFVDSAGMTPAYYAHHTTDKELSALLDSVQLDSGLAGGGRARDKTLALAFRNALANDDLALCQSLHANGCDLTTSFDDCAGGSLVSEAIRLKRVPIIEWMLQQGVSMTTAVSDTKSVELAIHLVLKDADLVDILPASLENYAKNGGTLLGEIPNVLSTAVQSQNIKGLKALIQHAKDNQSYYGKLCSIHPDRVIHALVNEADTSSGWTPLHVAVDYGALRAVQVLLESGADINAETKRLDTPLSLAIASTSDLDEAIALHLIQAGADLERRDVWCETPAITAAGFGRIRTTMALVHANVDINAKNNNFESPAHFAAKRGNLVSFADLMHRGADPCGVDIVGFSAFHHAIEDSNFVSFLLHSNLRLEDSVCFPWHLYSGNQAAWLTTAYPLFRKRYGLQALRKFANLVPSGIQAPLCKGAKLGAVLFMENLLELGAPIDLEGCSSGSALMTACKFGRKESVEYLVRRGAVLSYNGANGFQSAIKSAKGNKKILRWLLVDRFVDQQKLTDGCNGIAHDKTNRGPFSWGGPIQAELVISGRMERLCHQSSREYWSYLMKEKIRWRGKILPSNTRRRTVSHSNIVPREIVRIHTQGYNSNGHEEAWFSKKVPKIQSDGRCWYMSYIP